MRPLSHSDEVPVPIFNQNVHRDSWSSSASSDGEDTPEKSPQLFVQSELDDLVRDLGLSKESAQLPGSRSAEKNLLARSTRFAWYMQLEQEFMWYFIKTDDMVYWYDVPGLVGHMGKEYDPGDWRLFIDSSTRSLKAVLLFNDKKVASLHIGHSVTLKECYATMPLLLNNIQYQNHKWLLCGEPKVLSILLGKQGGHTKHPCFCKLVGQSCRFCTLPTSTMDTMDGICTWPPQR